MQKSCENDMLSFKWRPHGPKRAEEFTTRACRKAGMLALSVDKLRSQSEALDGRSLHAAQVLQGLFRLGGLPISTPTTKINQRSS